MNEIIDVSFLSVVEADEVAMAVIVDGLRQERKKDNRMNNSMIDRTPTPKSRLRKWHFQLLGSQVAIAAFVMFLALYTSREMLLAGLCGLATLTMIIAFAAFFRAYQTD